MAGQLSIRCTWPGLFPYKGTDSLHLWMACGMEDAWLISHNCYLAWVLPGSNLSRRTLCCGGVQPPSCMPWPVHYVQYFVRLVVRWQVQLLLSPVNSCLVLAFAKQHAVQFVTKRLSQVQPVSQNLVEIRAH